MLVVSFHLVGLVAMLTGIDVQNVLIELDSLNDPTLRPIPGAKFEWCRAIPISRPHVRRGASISGLARRTPEISTLD